MNVSISKQYEEGFSIVVDDATRNEVLAIRSLTDKQQGIALTPVAFEPETSYANGLKIASRLLLRLHGSTFNLTETKFWPNREPS
jgi:hypothetical protein